MFFGLHSSKIDESHCSGHQQEGKMSAAGHGGLSPRALSRTQIHCSLLLWTPSHSFVYHLSIRKPPLNPVYFIHFQDMWSKLKECRVPNLLHPALVLGKSSISLLSAILLVSVHH